MPASRALRYLLAPALLGALLLGAGCASEPDLPKGNPHALAVGAVLPLSGPDALLGKSLQQGLQLGAVDVNAAGGVNGKPIALGILDSGGDLTDGILALQKWRDRGVPILLIGDTSLAIQQAADVGDYPQLIGFLCDYVAGPSLTPKNGVRIYLNGDQEGRLLEGYLAAAGVNKVAILYAGTDLGASNAKYLEFLIHGDYISTYKDAYTPTERDYLPLVKAMSQLHTDALALVGYGPEYPSIIETFALSGWKGLIVAYLGNLNLAGLTHLHGLAATTIYPVPAYIVDPSGTAAGAAFVQEYRAKYGSDPDLPAAYAYDNIRALAASAAHATSLQSLKIREAFIGLKSYTGAAGTYTITPDGDTQMPLQLITGDGHPAPPPPKPALPPEMTNVPMPAKGLGMSITEQYLNSLPSSNSGNTTTPPANSPAPSDSLPPDTHLATPGKSYSPPDNTTTPPASDSPPPAAPSVIPLTTTPIRE